jgi:hypothetical protein
MTSTIPGLQRYGCIDLVVIAVPARITRLIESNHQASYEVESLQCGTNILPLL